MKIKDVILEQFTFDPSKITDMSMFEPEKTGLMKDFEIINHEPLTIEYLNDPKRRYVLNSEGEWAYLGSDRPLHDENLAAALTKAAGLDKPAPAATPQPAQPIAAVKDNAGVVWVKNKNGVWSNQDGSATVTDPTLIKRLEQRALIQAQNKQMGG